MKVSDDPEPNSAAAGGTPELQNSRTSDKGILGTKLGFLKCPNETSGE